MWTRKSGTCLLPRFRSKNSQYSHKSTFRLQEGTGKKEEMEIKEMEMEIMEMEKEMEMEMEVGMK